MNLTRFTIDSQGDLKESLSGEFVDYRAHRDLVYELRQENAELRKKYRWRDVKEELPDNDDEILIWPHHKYAGSTAHFNPYEDNGDGVGKNEFYYSTDDQWGEDYYHEINVTHWMPLPSFDVEKQLNLKAVEIMKPAKRRQGS